MANKKNQSIIFENQKVRHIEYNNEIYFSVVDIVVILTENEYQIGRKYWNKLKERLINEGGNESVSNCHQLKLLASDGKKYKTDCANLKNCFRIIQSIPSKKAEPFKMWLAQLGKERIDEIQNPELAQERMKRIYEQKGYPKEWIDKRLRGMAIRQNLTDEWKERGVEIQKEFSILTAEISKATFGMTPSEYKNHKGLKNKNHNLRDNMTDLELIFAMLGERVTTEISQQEKPDTFHKNKKVAKRGGKVAGNARKDTEKELGRSVVEKTNYLDNKKKKNIK